MNGIYLLLGSNIGNRLAYLKEAATLLSKENIIIIEESSIYETEPWGPKDQDWFLNVILEISTSYEPKELLEVVLKIESELGRVRKEKWGERCIDIDILYFKDEVVDDTNLSIPHLGIPNRKFTLMPLAEMCPLEKHPTLDKTQMELFAECTDPLDCILTDYKL